MKLTYSYDKLPEIAKEVLALVPPSDAGATILALSGPLGAGKTILTQEIAKLLGVVETVVSPTFVIAKWYTAVTGGFDTLVHVDAYRIESEEELVPLGFSKLLKKPNTLVVIEWPERLPILLSHTPCSLFMISHEGEMRTILGPHHEKTI